MPKLRNRTLPLMPALALTMAAGCTNMDRRTPDPAPEPSPDLVVRSEATKGKVPPTGWVSCAELREEFVLFVTAPVMLPLAIVMALVDPPKC